MPTLEEMLPKLSKAKIFSALDAKDNFYQFWGHTIYEDGHKSHPDKMKPVEEMP